jgi:hypothetical protein
VAGAIQITYDTSTVNDVVPHAILSGIPYHLLSLSLFAPLINPEILLFSRFKPPIGELRKPLPIMVYDWEGKREICYQMYIKDKKALEEIMEYMKTTYQFAPR